MNYEVVAGPRLKRDWAGRLVRTKREFETGMNRIMAGTIMTIVARPNKGASLETEKCRCCGAALRVSRVPDCDFEFVARIEP